jgi:hypothetical protein
MGKAVKKLSARAVATIAQPGRHSDGDGLYLNVTRSGARSWLFMWKKDGKRREMGLGSTGSVSLARARELASECRAQVAAGLDPIEARDAAAEIKPEKPTFGAIADALIAAKESEWRNEKHRAQWRASLTESLRRSGLARSTKSTRRRFWPSSRPYGKRGRKPPRDCAGASRRFWTRPRRKAIDRAKTRRHGAATSRTSCRSAGSLRAAIMPRWPIGTFLLSSLSCASATSSPQWR